MGKKLFLLIKIAAFCLYLKAVFWVLGGNYRRITVYLYFFFYDFYDGSIPLINLLMFFETLFFFFFAGVFSFLLVKFFNFASNYDRVWYWLVFIYFLFYWMVYQIEHI